jgi:hypothetical protein
MKQGRAARKSRSFVKKNTMNPLENTLLPEHIHEHPLTQQFSCYWTDQNCASTAVDLIHFGYGQFRRAKKIGQLDMLKALHTNGNQPEYQKEVLEFGLEGVIDAVRICICFENYMKAKLLAEGFLVHELDKDVTGIKDLAKAQRERPVSLKEAVHLSGGWSKSPDGLDYLVGVRKQTLKMSWMLGKAYQEKIDLPASVLKYLDGVNKQRNELHFYMTDGFSTSDDTIESIQNLIRFVTGPMTTMHDSLIDNYKLPERFLIRTAPVAASP